MSMEQSLLPKDLRTLIRDGQWRTPTTGLASGYVQGNLVMLPKPEAFSFLLFCIRNPKPCPVLDVLEAGTWEPKIAPEADLRTDLPRYRIYRRWCIQGRGDWMSVAFFRMISSAFFSVAAFLLKVRF